MAKRKATRKAREPSAEFELTLASVIKEMAEPRLPLSVRAFLNSWPVPANPRFCDGEVVYNRFTKEDGKVTRSYDLDGITMCEVTVPAQRNSWRLGRCISDWEESRLELSANQHLK